MKSFAGKRAVVTGGGAGIGRELVLRLVSEGASVATCDVNSSALEETRRLAVERGSESTIVATYVCDVSKEEEVIGFRDEVVHVLGSRLNLLFNIAGINGGPSFLTSPRDEWERTFAVNWFGVYYCSRAFVPLVVASDEGYIVNMSSMRGFYASHGPGEPHSAYSTSKYAVKGFTESLIDDLRAYAPHVKVAVVMPGKVETDILLHSQRYHLGDPSTSQPDDTDLGQRNETHRSIAQTSAEDASSIILDGVRAGAWRILVGDDAKKLDERVRADPEDVYR